jgi:hypothetical protein
MLQGYVTLDMLQGYVTFASSLHPSIRHNGVSMKDERMSRLCRTVLTKDERTSLLMSDCSHNAHTIGKKKRPITLHSRQLYLHSGGNDQRVFTYSWVIYG